MPRMQSLESGVPEPDMKQLKDMIDSHRAKRRKVKAAASWRESEEKLPVLFSDSRGLPITFKPQVQNVQHIALTVSETEQP